MDIKINPTYYIYFTGKDFTLQRFMINEEYVFHLKWVVMLFQNSVVEKRLVDVICGDKTAGEKRDKTLHCSRNNWCHDDAGVCGWGFSNDGPENDFGEMKHSLPDIFNKLY